MKLKVSFCWPHWSSKRRLFCFPHIKEVRNMRKDLYFKELGIVLSRSEFTALPEQDARKQHRDALSVGVFCMRLRFVLVVQNPKPFENQFTVADDITLAVFGDIRRKAAGGDHSGLFPELL